MSDIFLSYRRSDAEDAACRIRDQLRTQFGSDSVFIDVDTILAGDDFQSVIRTEIELCRVLVVIIGPNWLNAKDDDGARRIDMATDWVRIEIDAALSRDDVKVIPVLISNACLPKSEALPKSIQRLTDKNAARIRSGFDFNSDMSRLIQAIGRHLRDSPEHAPPLLPPEPPRIKPSIGGNRTLHSRQLPLASVMRRRVLYIVLVGVIALVIIFAARRNPQEVPVTNSGTRQEVSVDPRLGAYSETDTRNKLISSGGNLKFEGVTQKYGDDSSGSAEYKNSSTEYKDRKVAAITAFSKGDYIGAAKQFEEIRGEAITITDREDPLKDSDARKAAKEVIDDPEILIFKNNAKARDTVRSDQNQKLYRIIAAVPLTDAEGKLFELGRNMLQGIAQAQDKIVSQPDSMIRLPSLNLEVVIVNDRNIPGQAVVSSETALSQGEGSESEDILAVVGHYTSDSTCAALENVYSDESIIGKKIVIISPLSTRTGIKKDCGNGFFFRTASSTAVEATSLVRHFISSLQVDPQDAKVAIFYNSKDGFSRDLFSETSTRLEDNEGIKTIEVKELSSLSTDQERQNASKKAQSADAWFVLPDGNNANPQAFDNAIELVNAAPKAMKIFGSNPLYGYNVAQRLGGGSKIRDRLFLALDWDFECASDNFKKEIEKYWFGRLNRTVASSYEAVQVLAYAFVNIDDSKAPNERQQVRNFLDDLNDRESDVELVVSHAFKEDTTISFDDDGDREEIKNRLIVTGSDSEIDASVPFEVVNGCP